MFASSPLERILVTGGAGFIGSALIRFLIQHTSVEVLNIDSLTHGSNLQALKSVDTNPKYHFIQADICDSLTIRQALQDFKPHAIMHLAAESHVDRSITQSHDFIHSNINGTHTLLCETQIYWEKFPSLKQYFRFLHVSTDEVYGSLEPNDLKFTEQSPYAPNSPYSASKAGSDHLVRAWFETYGFPALITHCSNNYGPWQDYEKLIPGMIQHALSHEFLPIYGHGNNIRDWIYVDDHVRALWIVLRKGNIGEVYNMGGNNELTNNAIVEQICALLDSLHPNPDHTSYKESIIHTKDRLGHDFRYAIDNSKIMEHLHWSPEQSFHSGLQKTIQFYLQKFFGSHIVSY